MTGPKVGLKAAVRRKAPPPDKIAGMETQLSPDALEALARSVAVKLEGQMATTKSLANQMLEFHQKDAEFKAQDAEFKQEVRDMLRSLRRTRSYVPVAALAAAVLAVLVSLFTLSRTAEATQTLSDDLKSLRAAVAGYHHGE